MLTEAEVLFGDTEPDEFLNLLLGGNVAHGAAFGLDHAHGNAEIVAQQKTNPVGGQLHAADPSIDIDQLAFL